MIGVSGLPAWVQSAHSLYQPAATGVGEPENEYAE
jgi:hypothetical protein